MIFQHISTELDEFQNQENIDLKTELNFMIQRPILLKTTSTRKSALNPLKARKEQRPKTVVKSNQINSIIDFHINFPCIF